MPGSYKPNMNHVYLISELYRRSLTCSEVNAEFLVQPECCLCFSSLPEGNLCSYLALLTDVQLQDYQSCKKVEVSSWLCQSVLLYVIPFHSSFLKSCEGVAVSLDVRKS